MELVENGAGVLLELEHNDILAVRTASSFWRSRLSLREEPLVLTPTASNRYLLQARGVAGFIKVGRNYLEIAPKFLSEGPLGSQWRTAMWRFLAFGRGIQALAETSGRTSNEGGIADVMADLFLSSLRGAAARGYPVGYRAASFRSEFMRGRLDPRKYSRLGTPNGKLDVIAQHLTLDTPTNRLLKWAGGELGKLVDDPSRRRDLAAWQGDLVGVSTSPPNPNHVPSPVRHHPYLVHAVELSKLLFDDRRPGFGEGSLTLPGFLWDSEDLFERAVRRLMREASRNLGLDARKVAHRLASRSSPTGEVHTTTTPDVSIVAGEEILLIADAKYKPFSTSPQSADFYQVLAGGRVTGVPVAALVYPHGGAGLSSRLFTPAGYGQPRSVYTLSLGLAAFASKAGIGSLRTELQGWLSEAIRSVPQMNLTLSDQRSS